MAASFIYSTASCSATYRYRVVKHSAGSAYKQILKYLLNNYKQRKQLDLPKMHGQTTFEARDLTNKHSTVMKCGSTCFYISSEHDDVSEF